MKTPLQILHKYFHHFNSERTRDLVVRAMEEYAKIYHETEVKKFQQHGVSGKRLCVSCEEEKEVHELCLACASGAVDKTVSLGKPCPCCGGEYGHLYNCDLMK